MKRGFFSSSDYNWSKTSSTEKRKIQTKNWHSCIQLLLFSRYDRSFSCTTYFDLKIWLWIAKIFLMYFLNLRLKLCIPCPCLTQNWTRCWLFVDMFHENILFVSVLVKLRRTNLFFIELTTGQSEGLISSLSILQFKTFRMVQQNCRKKTFAQFHWLNGRFVFGFFLCTFPKKSSIGYRMCEWCKLSNR